MLVYDDTNWRTLIGDGTAIVAAGERRLLSAIPKPAGHNSRLYSKVFGSNIPRIPRSEWSARIKTQKQLRARISDHQKFKPDNQGSLPTCWAAGTCHAATTCRVMQGLPYKQISACSVAVPISGGRSGGYEGDAVEYLTKYGGATVDVWPYTAADRSFQSKPEVVESRKRFIALETYECNGFDDFATAALLGFPMTVSYNWWSHVVMLADLIEIEANSFGFLIRNNWGDWGDANDYGFKGYAVFREGKGTPSGGYAFRQMLLSV